MFPTSRLGGRRTARGRRHTHSSVPVVTEPLERRQMLAATAKILLSDGVGTELTTSYSIKQGVPLFVSGVNYTRNDSAVVPASTYSSGTGPQSARFQWDFGDGNDYSTYDGFIASHIYPNTGAFPLKLTLTDAAGSVSTKTVTINVSTNTRSQIYVDEDTPGVSDTFGNDANPGTQASPIKTFAKALDLVTTNPSYLNNVEVLFHKDDTFPVTAAPSNIHGTNVRFGSYGSGNKPNILSRIISSGSPVMISTWTDAHDTVVEGLCFDNDETLSGAALPIAVRTRGTNIAVKDCEFKDIESDVKGEVTPGPKPRGILMQGNNQPVKTQGGCVWVAGDDWVMLGNTIMGSKGENSVRLDNDGTLYSRFTLWENFVSSDYKATITFRGNCEYVSIARCHVEGAPLVFGSYPNPNDDGTDNVNYGIMDGNYVEGTRIQINRGVLHAMLRNNVIEQKPGDLFNREANSQLISVGSTREVNGAEVLPVARINDLQIINNTGYTAFSTNGNGDPNAVAGNFLSILGRRVVPTGTEFEYKDFVVVNNLYRAPNVTQTGWKPAVESTRQEYFIEVSGNVWADPNSSITTDPINSVSVIVNGSPVWQDQTIGTWNGWVPHRGGPNDVAVDVSYDPNTFCPNSTAADIGRLYGGARFDRDGKLRPATSVTAGAVECNPPAPTVPNAPTSLAAAAGDGSVSLSWHASANATSYTVYRSTTSNGTFANVGTTSGTSFVNANLTNGTTYYYRVSASNSAGESGVSNQVSATPQAVVPGGGIVADFANGYDGTSGVFVDAYRGKAGNGWNDRWDLIDYGGLAQFNQDKAINTNPLTPGGGYYLSAPLNSVGTTTPHQATVFRPYTTYGGVDTGKKHRITFDYRLDSALTNFNTAEDRVVIFGDSRGMHGTTTTNTWSVMAPGAADAAKLPGAVADKWCFIEGDNAGTLVQCYNTNVPLVQNGVYHFTIDVDPVNKTFTGRVDYGAQSYQSGTLRWRSGATYGSTTPTFINFGGRLDAASENITFSMDSLHITPVASLTSENVGFTTPAGSTTEVTPGSAYDVTGAGTDINLSSDTFRFVYDRKQGNFDVKVRVIDLVAVDTFTKAGLMARESIAPNSAHGSMLVDSGGNFKWRSRATTGGSTISNTSGAGSFASDTVYLRLQRVGNTVSGFSSTNGTTWTPNAQWTFTTTASELLVGMVVASHSATQTTTAQFRELVM